MPFSYKWCSHVWSKLFPIWPLRDRNQVTPNKYVNHPNFSQRDVFHLSSFASDLLPDDWYLFWSVCIWLLLITEIFFPGLCIPGDCSILEALVLHDFTLAYSQTHIVERSPPYQLSRWIFKTTVSHHCLFSLPILLLCTLILCFPFSWLVELLSSFVPKTDLLCAQ